jgi:hypothetical protein
VGSAPVAVFTPVLVSDKLVQSPSLTWEPIAVATRVNAVAFLVVVVSIEYRFVSVVIVASTLQLAWS